MSELDGDDLSSRLEQQLHLSSHDAQPAHESKMDDDDKFDDEDTMAPQNTNLTAADEDDDDDDEDDDELSDVETTVDLGFVSPPSHPLRLSRAYFPSKVGGRPAWLNPRNVPNSTVMSCPLCHDSLVFLLQLYAPVRSSPQLFHRSLFLFTCRRQQCVSRHCAAKPTVVCWRSQLPLENAFYPAVPAAKLGKKVWKEGVEVAEASLDGGSVPLCAVCGMRGDLRCSGCRTVRYCGERCQKADWRMGHKAECCRGGEQQPEEAAAGLPVPAVSAQRHLDRSLTLFPAYELSIETEYIAHSAGDFTKEKELLSAYEREQQMAAAAGEDEDDDGLSSLGRLYKRDAAFARFRRRIAHNPQQVLRYERNGTPLWVSDVGQLAADAPVLRCEHCGGRRVLECQVLPQLLYYLEREDSGARGKDEDDRAMAVRALRDGLDWGSLYLYTCETSCGDGERDYMREIVHVQHHSGLTADRQHGAA